MLEGIDVYEGSGAIEWHRVAAAGKSFAFVRGAYGTRADKMAKQNFAAAKAEGLTCGLYQFFRQPLPVGDQIQCFAAALDACGVGKGDLPPVIDVEDNPYYDGAWNTGNNGAYIGALGEWVRFFKEKFGVTPILYTRSDFWQTLGNPPGFSECPLWIARYSTAHPPVVPQGWNSWLFWQYAEDGSVDGIAGHSDLNRTTLADSAALAAVTIR